MLGKSRQIGLVNTKGGLAVLGILQPPLELLYTKFQSRNIAGIASGKVPFGQGIARELHAPSFLAPRKLVIGR